MSKILDEINRELSMELYNLKIQLREVEGSNKLQEARIKEYEKLYLELYDLKMQLSEYEAKSESQAILIEKLRKTCDDLKTENTFLKNEISAIENKKLKEEPKPVTPVKEAKSTKVSPQSDKNNNAIEKRKATIAMLLKSTQGESPTFTSQVNQQIIKPNESFSPMKLEVSKNPTRSLMVTNLYQGLGTQDILQHFSKYGSIVLVTIPPITFRIQEGKKYMFIKYSNYEAVEKAMENRVHEIRKNNLIVNVMVNKGKDFD